MSNQDFATSITVDRSPQEVFDAVADVRGWWSTGIQGEARHRGDVFEFEVPGIHCSTISLTEVVEGGLVVWHVDDAWLSFIADTEEWTGTEMRFEITAVDGGSELRFTHLGLAPAAECFEVCSNAWQMYITQSLKQRILTGVGAPHSPETGITRREAELLEDHAASRPDSQA